MSVSDEVLDLIEAVHTAGLDPQRWPSVTSEIAAHFGARVAGMFVYRPGDPSWNFSVNVGSDPEWMARFQGDFTVNDNLCEQAFRDKPVGSVAADWMLVPLPVLRKTRLINEWAIPQGLLQAALVKTAMDNESVGLLSLIRPISAGEWETRDIDRLAVLARHIVRAVSVSQRIGALEGRVKLAEALLDHVAQPVLVADKNATIVYANRAATAMLDANDGITSHRGMIGAATRHETSRLRALISTAATGTGPRGGQIAISRPSGRQPFSVLITKGGPDFDAPVSLEARAVVFITDPEAGHNDIEASLRRLYSLTSAEARLVRALANGARSLGDAADRLGITLNTAKTHLKHAFDKTNTHRQSELVKLAILTSSARTT